MSMFFCAQCGDLKDSDDGCEELEQTRTNTKLVCIDCISNREDDEEVYHTSDSPATEYERVERMRAEMKDKMAETTEVIDKDGVRHLIGGGMTVPTGMREKTDLERAMDKAMGPDYSRKGIFRTHNCAYCRDGELPCRQGAVNHCDNPRARND